MQYRRLPTNDNNDNDVEDPLRLSESEPVSTAHSNNRGYHPATPATINNSNNNNSNDNTTHIPASPPSYSSRAPSIIHDRQQADLEETFDEPNSESQRLLSSSSSSRDHLPIPTSTTSFSSASSSAPATLPVANDGVFANMSAKPESERDKTDETPPAYEEAAADTTPPYWHTAVVAPTSIGDLILIEGLPAGNMLHFGWNLIISASFQFIGFMLTYLFHTTHAGKNGSRAGLGITFVQFGFYIRSRGQNEDGDGGSGGGELDGDQADIVAYLLMIFGWFIIIRSVAEYIRVKRMEKIIATQPSATADNFV